MHPSMCAGPTRHHLFKKNVPNGSIRSVGHIARLPVAVSARTSVTMPRIRYSSVGRNHRTGGTPVQHGCKRRQIARRTCLMSTVPHSRSEQALFAESHHVTAGPHPSPVVISPLSLCRRSHEYPRRCHGTTVCHVGSPSTLPNGKSLRHGA